MARSAADIFNAKTIAIVGATDRSHWPRNIYANLIESGFSGTVYPINPKRDEIFGVPCYPDLASLPEPAELALMIIPADAVEGALRQGAANGLKAAIVYAAGFGDGGREESLRRGAAFRNVLDELDIAVCGPNCMGLVGIRQKLYCYPHTHISGMTPGPVALVTQSGGTLSYFVNCAQERGLTFSYAVSSGNEMSLDLADYIEFLIDDPETRQICLFIEGIRRPNAFMKAAGRALEAGKPIIAIKTGRSQKSREAAASHSGAVAGDYAAFEAMCERYGIIACETTEEVIETTLAFQQGRLPKGPGIAFMTTSGGTVDLLHDYCDAENAVVPELAPETIEAIREFVPDDCHIRNPIDTGAPVGQSGRSSPVEICKAFARDPNIDMVAWCNNMPGAARSAGQAEHIRDLLSATDKPVISFARIPHMIPEGGLAFQAETNMPFVQGTRTGVRVMNALWFYGARAGRTVPGLPAPAGAEVNCIGEGLENALAKAGLALPRSARVIDPAHTAEKAVEIGFPVAVKILSPQASHKTEVGGIALGLDSSEAVTKATHDMVAGLKSYQPDAEIDGFLIQEMVSGVEVLLGARDDALYGPILVIGTGGVMVELIGDVALRLLPVSEDDIRTAIDRLKLKHLLGGFRGALPADTDALVAAAVAFGNFYLDHRRWLSEIEINPLMVLPAGRGVRAVDIRAIVRDQASEEHTDREQAGQ